PAIVFCARTYRAGVGATGVFHARYAGIADAPWVHSTVTPVWNVGSLLASTSKLERAIGSSASGRGIMPTRLTGDALPRSTCHHACSPGTEAECQPLTALLAARSSPSFPSSGRPVNVGDVTNELALAGRSSATLAAG